MLRHLNNQEMLAITSTWSTHPNARATFVSIPDIAPLYPKVVKVNAELLAIQPASSETSPKMQALLEQATKTDVDHDVLVRAVAASIEADRAWCLAAKPPQLRRAELAESVHAKLFPTGMAIVNVSILAESGNAARVAALLASDLTIAEYLDGIPLRGDRTVLDLAKRWIAVGKKLGRLEHERSVLVAKDATKPTTIANIATVRARWLRLVSQVISALELSDAPSEAIEIIRGPVQLASDRAARRYAEAPSATPDAPLASGEPEPLAATANG